MADERRCDLCGDTTMSEMYVCRYFNGIAILPISIWAPAVEWGFCPACHAYIDDFNLESHGDLEDRFDLYLEHPTGRTMEMLIALTVLLTVEEHSDWRVEQLT